MLTSIHSKSYIKSLLSQYPTKVIIKRNRLSKHGDYRFSSLDKKHQITVNGGLSEDAFLFVLLHEFAHRICFEKHGRKAKPHGKEWKRYFQLLLQEASEKMLFPDSVSPLILAFSKNPLSVVKMNSDLHRSLFSNLHVAETTVSDLKEGDLFYFRKKHFVKVEKRRTRIVCKEVKTGRLYLFNQLTPVNVSE